jgi:hypothetical protein
VGPGVIRLSNKVQQPSAFPASTGSNDPDSGWQTNLGFIKVRILLGWQQFLEIFMVIKIYHVAATRGTLHLFGRHAKISFRK